MDASAFEATASDVPDPPLSEITDLIHDDLQYAIAGAVAVIKHIAKLVVLVVALATCVVVYCFLLSWLALLWLQTRLFLITSTLLRECMGQPTTSRPRAIDAPETPEVKDQETVVAPKLHSRPELWEEWRDPPLEAKGKKRESDAVAAAVGGEREGFVEQEHVTKQDAPEQQRSQQQRAAAEQIETAENRAPEQRAAEYRTPEHRAEEQQKRLQWASFAHNASGGPTQKPKSWLPPTNQQQNRPSRPEAPKLSKEEIKVQEQSSWLDQLTFDPPSGPKAMRSQASRPPPGPSPAGFANRFGYTPEQLADAANFAATATKGDRKGRNPATSNRQVPSPFQASKKSTSAPSRPSQPVMLHAGNAGITAAKLNRTAESAPMGSASRLPSDYIAPHLRYAKEARAKRESSKDSPTEPQQAPAPPPTAPASEDTQPEVEAEVEAEIQPEAISEDKESAAPAEGGDRTEDDEMVQPESQLRESDLIDISAESQRPQTPDSFRQPGTLAFFEDTPLSNEAPHAMSPEMLKRLEMLKSWKSSTSEQLQVQAARLQNSEGGMLVFRSHASQAFSDSPFSERANSDMPAAPPSSDQLAQNPFMTPPQPPSKPRLGRMTSQDDIDDQAGEGQGSLQRPLPTADEFEAALFASHQDREDQEAVQSGEAEETARDDVEAPSGQPSKGKASIVQQAVNAAQEQAHAKHASTSTYATAREDATPAQQTIQRSDSTSLRNITSVAEAPIVGHTVQLPGSKSSQLTPSAPSFFAPAPQSTTSSSLPRAPAGPPSRPPPGLPYPNTINISGSDHQHGVGAQQFASTPFAANVQQPPTSVAPHAPQYLPGLGHASGPTASFFAPQQEYIPAPYAPLPGLGHFAPPTGFSGPPSTYGHASAPDVPFFTSHGPPHTQPYSTGSSIMTPWLEEDDNVSTAIGPRYVRGFDVPTSHQSIAADAPYQAAPDQYSRYSWSSGSATPAQPGLGNAMTAPVRRPSRAVPITRPSQTTAAAIDLKPENTFPRLPSAPIAASPSVPVQSTTPPKPPGLGDPKPKRQAAFDPPLSEPSPAGEMLKSANRSTRVSGGMDTFSAVSDRSPITPALSKVVHRDELKRRQLDSLRSFSESFKMPSSGSKLAGDDQTSTPRDSIASSGGSRKSEATTVVIAADDDAQGVPEGPNKPDQTATEGREDDGNDKEPLASSSTKRIKREAKKAARDAVTEAWWARETIRKKVVGSYTVEGATEFREKTTVYHERRDELIALMGNGKLNDDDAKVFPRFADLDLSVPKSRPEGAAGRKHKEDKTGSPTEAGSSSRVVSGDHGELSKARVNKPAKKATPLPANFKELKDMLGNAFDLLIEARGYKDEPRPQTNISYATWTKRGEAKIERAVSYYRTKRNALVAAFPDGELPDDVAEEFPLI